MNQATFWKLFGSIGIAGFAMLFLIFDGGVSRKTTVVQAYDPAWQYRVPFYIDAAYANADYTDMPIQVDLSKLPADFFTNVNADGSDIRVTESDGTTELPREVVTIDTAGGTGELYFKADVTKSVNNLYYIYYGNAGATEPASDSTYGSEAVWSDYTVVHHFNNFDGTQYLDSSGNGNHFSESDSKITTTTGLFGGTSKALVLTDLGQYVYLPTQPVIDIMPTSSFAMTMFVYNPEKNATVPFFGFSGQTFKDAYLSPLFLIEGLLGVGDGIKKYFELGTLSTFSSGEGYINYGLYQAAGSYVGFKLNSADIVTSNIQPINSTKSFVYGTPGFSDYGGGFVGYTDEFRIASVTPPSGGAMLLKQEFEWNMFTKQDSFFSFGVQEDVGSSAITWDGDAADGSWCSATNWSGDAVPTDSDDVVIDNGDTVDTSGCDPASVEFASLTLGETNPNKLYLYTRNMGTAGDVTVAGNGLLYQFETTTITLTGDLTIENGGALLSQKNDTSHEHSVNITAANIDIQSGGAVNVDGLGYSGGEGPGTSPTALNAAGGGAGHGGDGGSGQIFSSNENLGGTGTCDITNPTTIGSGGGGRNGSLGGSASDGGGHIRLVALGTLTINGSISADGEAGNGSSGGFADGGGAGGSIFLETDELSGTTGSITFTGGAGYADSQDGGGGGGGCMLLVYRTDSGSSGILDASAVTMSGGADAGSSEAGGAGVYLVKTASTNGTLYVNGSTEGVLSTQAASTVTVDALTVTGGGVYSVPDGKTFVVSSTNAFGGGDGTGSLRIDDGAAFTPSQAFTLASTTLEFHRSATWTDAATTIATIGGAGILDLRDYTTSSAALTLSTVVVADGGTITHGANTSTLLHTVNLAATTMTINAGGSIDVDAKGYSGDNGPGAGGEENCAGGGGGHGGVGGASQLHGGCQSTGGTAYATSTNPDSIQLGSGGGGRNGAISGTGSQGGGMIKLDISGTLTIEGTITADGAAGNGSSGGFDDGGGSGGGLYIQVDTLAGTPEGITLTGGAGHESVIDGGGGGGGAVYVQYETTSYVEGDFKVTGGTSGGGDAGSTGFVVLTQPNTVPIALIGIASQIDATFVTVTSSVSDADNNITSLAVEYSTDGLVWNDATLGTVSTSEGTISTSTGQVSGIDTDLDGTVVLTLYWNVATDISGTDDASVYLRITPNDGVGDGTTVSTTAFAVDTQAPIITDNGALTITTDGGRPGVAGIGDGITLSGVTTTIDDSHVITIDYGIVSGNDDTLLGAEGFVNAGDVDGFTTFTIRITDDIGNTTVTSSDALNIDNQAPIISDNGTVSISLDGGTGGIAGIGDEILLTGVSTTIDDSDEVTIDLSSIGASPTTVMGSTTTIVAGSTDDTAIFILTVTDNAGNIATTTADGISIDNIAPTAASGGTITITDDVDGNGIVAVGDRVTYNIGSLNTVDTVVWTIDFSDLTGQSSLVGDTLSNIVTTGSIDSPAQTFIVTLTDDAGNIATTTSGAVSVDNEIPTILNNGTISISTDNGVSDVAGVGDGLTLSGVTTAIDDNNIVTIDYGIVGGTDQTLMDTEGTIGVGSIDTTMTFLITVTDDGGNVATTTSDVVVVDNEIPSISNNGTVVISVDNAALGVAGIGDQIEITGVTTTENDGDIVTIDLNAIGLSTTSSVDIGYPISAGSIDATTSFVISVVDNAGNIATTTSDGISIDNIAPTAASGGTITISDDVDSNGTAAVGDRVTFTAGTLNTPDTVTWVIDLSALTGQSALAAGATSTAITTGTLDSATQTFLVTLTDDAGNTATTTSAAVDVDNEIPVLADNGTLSISTDGGTASVAGIGDGLTLSGVTTASDDDHRVTIDYGTVGGNDDTLMGAEGFVGTGSIDTSVSFVINITDDGGNSITSTSDTVNVDNQAPSISSSGTLAISTDANANGIAEIDDGLTLSGVTVTADDGDTVTIDLTTVTGESTLAMSTEDLVIEGAVSSSAYAAIITVTDNAGNTATTTSNAIAVNNGAPDEEEPEDEEEVQSGGGGGGGSTFIRIFQTKNSTSQFGTDPTESTDSDPEDDADNACTLPTDAAAKSPASNAVYYITTDCTKRAFDSAAKYFSYFTSWDAVGLTSEDTLESIPDDTLGFMPWGPLYNPASGALIKTPSDPKTYLLLDGTLYHIADEASAAFQFGPAWATWIEDVDAGLLDNYPLSDEELTTEGRPDGILIKYQDQPKVYQLDTENGEQVKRWIPDEATFQALKFRDDRIVTIPSTETYPDGSNVTL